MWATAKPVNGKDDEERGPVEGATFVTKNGDRFFLFGENGDLVIARLSPEKYDEVNRTKLLDPVGVGLGPAARMGITGVTRNIIHRNGADVLRCWSGGSCDPARVANPSTRKMSLTPIGMPKREGRSSGVG